MEMEFNKETFEKALKANKIVRYQQHFEAVVKSYLEIESQALRIHDVVGRSEQLACVHPYGEVYQSETECYCEKCGKDLTESI
jgi:hypothetical protein